MFLRKQNIFILFISYFVPKIISENFSYIDITRQKTGKNSGATELPEELDEYELDSLRKRPALLPLVELVWSGRLIRAPVRVACCPSKGRGQVVHRWRLFVKQQSVPIQSQQESPFGMQWRWQKHSAGTQFGAEASSSVPASPWSAVCERGSSAEMTDRLCLIKIGALLATRSPS